MKNAVIVYESSYGNTHVIAAAIADGLRPTHTVTVLPVGDAVRSDLAQTALAQADLVVVGGPTHVHGLSRPSTRKGARDAAGKPGAQLLLDPAATGPGLREWLETVSSSGAAAAAFDTRVEGPALLMGRASKEIGRKLTAAGFALICEPTSFLVTRATQLVDGQESAAQAWGRQLGITSSQERQSRKPITINRI